MDMQIADALSIVLLMSSGTAVAADLACGFDMRVGSGSLSWTEGSGATLRAEDSSRVRPLECSLPLIGARDVVEHGLPRHVFEFDAAACRSADLTRYAVSPRVTLVIHPEQGNRGTLFWQDSKVMDECSSVEVSSLAARAAKERRP